MAISSGATRDDDGTTIQYDYDVTVPAREKSFGPAGRAAVVRWSVGSAMLLESEGVTLGAASSTTTAHLAYAYDADAVVRGVTLTSGVGTAPPPIIRERSTNDASLERGEDPNTFGVLRTFPREGSLIRAA